MREAKPHCILPPLFRVFVSSNAYLCYIGKPVEGELILPSSVLPHNSSPYLRQPSQKALDTQPHKRLK